MNNEKKNYVTVLISSFLSIVLCYFLFFLKTHFEHHDRSAHIFSSIDIMKFHKDIQKNFII